MLHARCTFVMREKQAAAIGQDHSEALILKKIDGHALVILRVKTVIH